jgi:hypothetical protein
MASTVTEVRQAMAATAARALTERLEQLVRLQANLEPQAEPAAMVVQAELQALAGQPVAPLARLGPTASTAMVEQLAMAEPVVLVRTERLEQLVQLQANLEPQAATAAVAVRVELPVLAAQPVEPLARLALTASTAMVEPLAMAEPGDLVLRELMARPCLLMAEQGVSAAMEEPVALEELQVVWEAWPG